VGEGGELSMLAEQDRSLWDRRVIYRAYQHLDAAAEGMNLLNTIYRRRLRPVMRRRVTN